MSGERPDYLDRRGTHSASGISFECTSEARDYFHAHRVAELHAYQGERNDVGLRPQRNTNDVLPVERRKRLQEIPEGLFE